MKKNPLNLLVIAVLAMFVAFTGCKDYDDDINSLKSEIGTVKQTLSGIQSKVDGGAVITNVTSDGGGITITLSNGQSYKITNGKDGAAGAAGADGADGSVITIGDNGNWFIDDEDTGMPSKGADGEDGIYYEPNADGFWHMIDPNTDPATDTATDMTWLPEGTITAVWNADNSTVELYNVEGLDGPYVLGAGATVLTSLVHYPELYIGGVEAIPFRPYIFGWQGVTVPDPGNPDCPIVITPGDPGEVPCIYELGQLVNLGTNVTFRVIDPGSTVKYHVSPSALNEQMIKTDEMVVTSHIAEFRLGGIEDDQERNPFRAEYIGINNGVLGVKMFMQMEAFMEAYKDKASAYEAITLKGDDSQPSVASTRLTKTEYQALVGIWDLSVIKFWESFSRPSFEHGKEYEPVFSPVLALQVPHSEAALNMLPNGADPYVTSDYTRTTIEPIFEIDIAKKQNESHYYKTKHLFPDFLGIKSGGTDVAGVAYDNADKPKYGQYDAVNSDSMYINDNAKALADGMNLINQYSEGNPTLTLNTSLPLVKGAQDPRIIEVQIGKEVDLINYVQGVGHLLPYWPGNKNEDAKWEGLPIDIAEYGMEWEFELLDSNDETIVYELTSLKTNQQEFITLSDTKKGTIKSRVFSQIDAGAAKDRTPIVRVRILHSETGCVVSEAFIKILFTDVKAAEEEVVIDLGTYAIGETGPCDYGTYTMTVKQVNENIYNPLEISKDAFHVIYGPTQAELAGKYQDVVVDDKWVVDGGANITVSTWLSGSKPAKGTFKWVVEQDDQTGRTTYLPRFTFNPCDIVWCEGETTKSISAEVTIKPLDGKDGPTLTLTYTIVYTRYYQINKGDLITNYWDADFTHVRHHTWKPQLGDQDPDNFRYETNINGAFKTHPNRSLKLNETQYIKYDYIFAPAADQPMPKQDLDGTAIAVRVSDDGKKLQAKLDKDLNIGGETYTKGTWENVAVILDHTNTNINDTPLSTDPYASTGGEDWLNYQNTVLAKYLLNRSLEFSKARLQLRIDCECTGEEQWANVKILSKDGFNVHFLRPITLTATSKETYIDGVDMGKKGSIVNIAKMAALQDWHGDKFDVTPNKNYYYEYHDIQAITVNGNAGILWDGDLPAEQHSIENATEIPSTLYVAYLTVAQFETLYPTVAAQAYYGKGTYKWGMVVYDNINTTVVSDFNLYIPVSVEYKWGVVESQYVKVPVEVTNVSTKSAK